jgi:hypothetical protein
VDNCLARNIWGLVHVGDPRVTHRPRTRREPVEFAVDFLNREIVDARFASPDEAVFVEFPLLVALTPVPLARGIVPFVLKTDGNVIVGKGPERFD